MPIVIGVVDAPRELLVGGDHDDDVPIRLQTPKEGPRQLRLRNNVEQYPLQLLFSEFLYGRSIRNHHKSATCHIASHLRTDVMRLEMQLASRTAQHHSIFDALTARSAVCPSVWDIDCS